MTGISLFASGGIGDLALREAGVDVIVANELIAERAYLFEKNYPECKMIQGDIWKLKDDIVKTAKNILNGKKLDFLLATPPCQGMSKNGRGKLLNSYRKGDKSKFDPRNELVVPAIDIVLALKPEVLIMENVPEMKNTIIPVGDELMTILEYVKKTLEPEYIGHADVVEFANYGVPQRRQRLITVFTKNKALQEYFIKNKTFFPPYTHSSKPEEGKQAWVTLKEILKDVPPLDARTKETAICKDIPFHRVPILTEDKYFWVENTPQNKSAFDNQCINPSCKHESNVTHRARRDKEGINRSSNETPLYCEKCGDILPRPWVKKDGKYRLMKGFTSAYKRMDINMPSNTLTQNFSYACSDSKIHPFENRVLSIYEALKIHTIDQFDYIWERSDGKKVSDKLIKDIIGESVPPKGFYHIVQHLINIIKT